MTGVPAPILSDVDLDDADVENANRLLARHRHDPGGVCPACGQPEPCIPRRIAETVLLTAATRS